MLFQRLLLIGALICVPLVSFFITLWFIDNAPTPPESLNKAAQTEGSSWKIEGGATFRTNSIGAVIMRGPNYIYQEFVCNGHCDAEMSIYVYRADRANIGVIFFNAKREQLQNYVMPIDNTENKAVNIKKSISADAAFSRLYIFAWEKMDSVSFKDAKLSVH